MSTPRAPDRFDDVPGDDLRAAEYVLGVTSADERRAAQSRIDTDAAFAGLVDAWEHRFSDWLLRATPQAPSPHVWLRVRTQLGWSPIEGAKPARWNDVRTWRIASALAATVAIVAIAFALRKPQVAPAPPPAPPVVVAPTPSAPRPVTVLARDDGSTGWIASIDVAAGRIQLAPVPVPADAQGRVNELWVIPEGQAPISLGAVSHERAQTIEVGASIRAALRVGATLAVTLEPATGMPHAAPTGPIVAKGGITQL